MGADDKAQNKTEQATGKVKEGVGGATDNESLKQEGKKDQVKADAKQVGEDVKDTFKDGTDENR
ncbi:CsbD family protein [Arthrobacter sp. H14]|uniref:CsbD family protein n=1 Tax=Arthrobacter sp. H14 TaxID=1312959 RepID=UPI00047BAC86|nr:CsbD family protein [Arthrobacter sp. H14]